MPTESSGSDAHGSDDGRRDTPDAVRPRPRQLAWVWLVWWLLSAGFWLALDDTAALPELIVGSVAALLGATAATLVYAERLVQVRGQVRWGLHAWRPVVQAVRDLGLLAGVLWRTLAHRDRPTGTLRTVRFAPPGDDAEQTGRRVLATVAGSFAPNTVVLDIDEETGRMLVHQLVAQPGDRASVDPMRLG